MIKLKKNITVLLLINSKNIILQEDNTRRHPY